MTFFLDDRQWAEAAGSREPLSLASFAVIYVRHRAVAVYALMVLVASGLAIGMGAAPGVFAMAGLIVLVVYPFVEFLLHRYVLHGPLYRLPIAAKAWRRVHYDHHMNPSDLSVLFGSLTMTIPLVFALTVPLGLLTFGLAGASALVAAGFVAMMIYEWFHCAAHLPIRFSWAPLERMRRRHALHHFHAETGNFGIVTAIVDRGAGTIYDAASAVRPSPTVRNLGYVGDERERYPNVAALDDKVRGQ